MKKEKRIPAELAVQLWLMHVKQRKQEAMKKQSITIQKTTSIWNATK